MGFNQILMALEDMEKTTFITKWGTYCYRVMPFGLKNAGATYQRVATTLFHDMMHKDVEVYVDDMIVKSQGRVDHLAALERFFERIQKFRLRLNPKKYTFRVTSGKLLGHMVSEQGIEVDPDKIRAILDIPMSRTEKEIKGFLGSIVTDHLASLLTSKDRLADDDFLDEEFVAMTSLLRWCMYFDGATNQSNRGIGDSNLVLRQIHGDWKTRDVKLSYSSLFVDIPIDVVIRPLLIELRYAPIYYCLIGETEVQMNLPWYHDIYQFLRSNTYPEVATTKDRRRLRQDSTDRNDERGSHRSLRYTHGGHMLVHMIMRIGDSCPIGVSADSCPTGAP
ncbi:Retrovirus-related Pol polyprotein from transposon 17.6 [Vitis vinifera]|uniref:Retrovirus-related Pol polyprotein from transposon 17.6 n=1 Tax=Vitis vinifera TaxID=29760 RepID=A0A438H2F8_VITVI|nr:Retrovirus-related Pol polyprotein from transposon 17.6 [Vitis vinifera]